jgi:lipopolysaccharide export LptBFGC system permease protein LptF
MSGAKMLMLTALLVTATSVVYFLFVSPMTQVRASRAEADARAYANRLGIRTTGIVCEDGGDCVIARESPASPMSVSCRGGGMCQMRCSP